jgi:signal transduction histidine kinase
MAFKTNFPYSQLRYFLFVFLLGFTIPLRSQLPASLDSMLIALDKQDPDLVKTELLNDIAMAYAEVDPIKGLEYANKAKALALHHENSLDLARSNNAIASSYLMLVEMDSALFYYNIAFSIYEQEEDKKGMGEIKGNMGHVAYYSGHYDQALQYYFQTLAYFEEIGFQKGITNQHASLGNTYMSLEKYHDALHHDSIALKGFGLSGDSLGYAMVLGNMANIHSDLKEVNIAADYFQQAISLYERKQEPLGMGRNLINLAALFLDQGWYLPSLETAMKGLKICSESNMDLCTQYCFSNMGMAYLLSYQNKDSIRHGMILIPGNQKALLQNAILYLEQACRLTNKLESPQDFEDTHRALSQAYKYDGQYEKALHHHEIYAMMKDSLSSVDRASRIEQLVTEREIAVRDKQIELDKLQIKVKRNERIYFIIGLILLAGSLVMVFRNATNQRKSNQKLGALNHQISAANLQLGDRNEKLSTTLDELKSTQAQLIESERQKENEILRRRISRDIHDDISSGLSKISWMTEILRSKPEANEPEDVDMLNRIASYSRETVSKLGEIIWSTKPESDNFNGLVSYSREFLNKYLSGLPIRAHLDLQEDSDNASMNPELRRNLYLVLKEAVHNAVKYSKATDLIIKMKEEMGAYAIVVEDNGIGMEASGNSSNGNGLRNMQGRMKDVKGAMVVRSASGTGTRIEFSGKLY